MSNHVSSAGSTQVSAAAPCNDKLQLHQSQSRPVHGPPNLATKNTSLPACLPPGARCQRRRSARPRSASPISRRSSYIDLVRRKEISDRLLSFYPIVRAGQWRCSRCQDFWGAGHLGVHTCSRALPRFSRSELASLGLLQPPSGDCKSPAGPLSAVGRRVSATPGAAWVPKGPLSAVGRRVSATPGAAWVPKGPLSAVGRRVCVCVLHARWHRHGKP